MDINIVFCRQMLRRRHEELRNLFPGTRLMKDASVLQSSFPDQWLFEIVMHGIVWSEYVKADNAYEARCKGWDAFEAHCAKTLVNYIRRLAS